MHVLTLKCTSSPPHSSNPKCSALHLHFISTYGKTAARWSQPEDKSHNASRWSGRVHYGLHSVWMHLQWWTRRPAFWVFDHQTPWPGWTSEDDQPTWWYVDTSQREGRGFNPGPGWSFHRVLAPELWLPPTVMRNMHVRLPGSSRLATSGCLSFYVVLQWNSDLSRV